jgi:hypothetical protein
MKCTNASRASGVILSIAASSASSGTQLSKATADHAMQAQTAAATNVLKITF